MIRAPSAPDAFLPPRHVTSPDALPDTRWTLTPGANLAARVWEAECVVHHALSNDTHRLAAWLWPALQRLGRAEPAGLNELSALTEVDAATVEDALGQLEQVQLVTRC